MLREKGFELVLLGLGILYEALQKKQGLRVRAFAGQQMAGQCEPEQRERFALRWGLSLMTYF